MAMNSLAVCRPSLSLFPTRFTAASVHHSRPHLITKRQQSPRLRIKVASHSSSGAAEEATTTDEVDYKVLTAVKTNYNDIVVLDTRDSRVLLLDSSNNVHSILHKGKEKWTNAYWDEFATLPAIVPTGPVAIFGLGAATAAHLMLELWPSLKLVGWEIDEILIEKARQYFGLCDLEKGNESGGVLEVHIGDVFTSRPLEGGYAGIIVDLFCDGKVLHQLEKDTTWLDMNKMLMPNGRIMVNCGAATKEGLNGIEISDPCEVNTTINASWEAFGGELSWKKLPKEAGENYLALTGPLPDLAIWSATVPAKLSSSVKEWRSCMADKSLG